MGDVNSHPCGICDDDSDSERGSLSTCSDHVFCRKCWETHLSIEFDEKRRSFLAITCPSTACEELVDLPTFKKFMSPQTAAHFASVLKTIPEHGGRTLDDYAYFFDGDGVLRHCQSRDRFHFVSQAHYVVIGDLVCQQLQKRMMEDHALIQSPCPIDAKEGEATCNIFMSADALTCSRLLVLIQGSGAVRPGQWARALCTNDSLCTGSMLPYITLARKEGFGVLILNPNENEVPVKPIDPPTREEMMSSESSYPPTVPMRRVRGSESASRHTIYVFENFVINTAKASKIAIVAHSAGGAATVDLLRQCGKQLMPRVKAIAFTDSVHSLVNDDSAELLSYLEDAAINWVTSDDPVDVPQSREGALAGGCRRLSAGHERHEYTSATAMHSVFRFIRQRLAPS